ncbi:PREDICTED: RHOMBOID-like protein 8 [Tarenaya hassleriana]|uniref:RHOMBOID-like protein 8 n=1 Tax=Tarenaya hassleriana TaxID=28532 RepID=UPI00053C1312|nr:PREDICTED: RHOMBOID-like protein 8 [Tarenaya hassleriana]
MENPSKPKSQIGDCSGDLRSSAAADPHRDKFPFFRHRSRQISRDTWLISVFVLLQIVIFAVTMGVNDCPGNSYGDCAAEFLGRFSFQPLSENPMLGPSASTLEHMGALRSNILAESREIWRIFTSQWLHSGLFHLLSNLGSLIFVGIYMEQEFGPMRIAAIYVLSSALGSLFAVVFVQDIPSVCPAAALFGLIGAMLSALARNWNLYSNKTSAIMLIVVISSVNFLLGFLPYIDNFANIGGLVSGFLLGFVLLFAPQLRQVPPHKASFLKSEIKRSEKLKEKFDRPILRIICLALFCVM